MKNLLIIFGLALVIYGCGKDGGGGGTANTAVNNNTPVGCLPGQTYNQYGQLCTQIGQNQCTVAGQVNTNLGCLAPCANQPGLYQYNGQCVYAQVINNYNYGYGYNGGYYNSGYNMGWNWYAPQTTWQWGYPNTSRCVQKSWYWYCY